MKKLKTIPIYGYGWQEAGQTVSTPSAFKILIESFKASEDEKHYTAVFGRIVSHCHRYRGLWILLQERTGEGNRYSVRLYKDASAVNPETLNENSGASLLASGFVALDLKS